MDSGEIAGFLASKKISFRQDFPLYEYTTFRIGGNADFFVTPRNSEEMALLQSWLGGRGIPVFILGGGSNILVSDAGFRGVVIHPDLGEDLHVIHQSSSRLQLFVSASARAPLAGKKISAMGFAGLEFLTTIPGEFGGSVIQNAGCYGHELKDTVISVEVITDGEVRTLPNASCGFGYRDSLFKRTPAMWVAGATLEIGSGDLSLIEEKISDYKGRRIASQPKNRRSAGSIFKNPPKNISAKKSWQLIEEAGLRGVQEGGAEISQEHCNFIVNNGAAKAREVFILMQLIEKKVFETTGVQLEREVVLVGDFSQTA
jgi:UDP-N-acetylmuramate dehydrogenase